MHVHMRYVKSAIFTRAEYLDFEAFWRHFSYVYVWLKCMFISFIK